MSVRWDDMHHFRVYAGNSGGAKIVYVAIRTRMQRLKRYINLCSNLMQRSHVVILCSNQMSIFSVGFPVSAVEYFSIFSILYLSLPFSVGFLVSTVEYFSKLSFYIYQCLFGFSQSVFPKIRCKNQKSKKSTGKCRFTILGNTLLAETRIKSNFKKQ